MRLPALSPRSWPDLVENFEALQKWFTRAGDRVKGTVTLTWPGGTPTTSTATVSHGLGTTPKEVLVGIQGTSVVAMCWANAVGLTTFQVAAHTGDGTSPAAGTTMTVGWEAIA